MTALEMLQKFMIAQVKSNLALGAAIEELTLWIEQHAGAQTARNAHAALNALDDSSELIGHCFEEMKTKAQNS